MTAEGAEMALVTLIERHDGCETPQLPVDVTQMLPEFAPVVTVMLSVFCPEVIDQPEGTVQL